jgi:hypothetical protein
LLDITLLGSAIFDGSPRILFVWPSAFMLSGFHEENLASLFGLLISVLINVGLYVLIGLALSSAFALLMGRRQT